MPNHILAPPLPRLLFGALLFPLLTCLTVQAAGKPTFSFHTNQEKTNGHQPGQAPSSQEIESRRADLRFLMTKLREIHKNPYHAVSAAQLEAAEKTLFDRIPTLERHQFIVELMRIVAMIGDGHTAMAPRFDPAIGFHRLPLLFYSFKDGVFVQAAQPAYAPLVGGKVLKFGKKTMEEVFRSVSGVTPRDNDMTLKNTVPFYLTIPEVLHGLGLTDDPTKVDITVEKNGREITMEVPGLESGPGAGHGFPSLLNIPEKWVEMRAETAKPSIWSFKPVKDAYWFEYVPESRCVYVQYNQSQDKPDESIEAFARRLFDFVNRNEVERMILDLRWNSGGNLFLNKPLLLGIIKADKINQRGRLFSLIGRTTFSAAQNFVGELERYTNTLFVGEPTGASPNHYGDHVQINLPRSGISVFISTLWHQMLARENRRWTPPQIAAELTSQDYLANLDPALKAAFGYNLQKSLGDRMFEAVQVNDWATAGKYLQDFKADPANAYVSAEAQVNTLGYRLLNQGRVEPAVAVFKLNVAAFPQSANVYDSLGEALAKQGNLAEAIKNYEKTLVLNPDNPNAVTILRQLKKALAEHSDTPPASK
ncbi:MAG: tetratricopeptide repeat protein [Blastocatellia bacterium]|nr:tetratricopeptide repeat protein [Blastocatellia bacterium]